MSIDWLKIEKGTKVQYKDNLFNEVRYGYFAGIFKPTESIKVSKIDRDFEFTETKMDSYGVCDYIKMENVELLK